MASRSLWLNPVVRLQRMNASKLISDQAPANAVTKVSTNESRSEASQFPYITGTYSLKSENYGAVKVEWPQHSELIIKEEPLESQFEEYTPAAAPPTIQLVTKIKQEQSMIERSRVSENGQSKNIAVDNQKVNGYACDLSASSLLDENTFKQRKYKKASTVEKFGRQSTITRTKNRLTCDICQKSVSSKSKLKSHTLVHSDDRLFQCETCYKRFKHQSTLRRHQAVHAVEKNLKCLICNKSFKSLHSLQSHQSCQSNTKLFQCDTCKKYFAKKTSLKRHLPVHKRTRMFSCDVCHNYYVSKSSLKQHSIVHSDEKKFRCKICHKSFKRNAELINHNFYHGERRYECDICHRKLFTRIHVKRHINRHFLKK